MNILEQYLILIVIRYLKQVIIIKLEFFLDSIYINGIPRNNFIDIIS